MLSLKFMPLPRRLSLAAVATFLSLSLLSSLSGCATVEGWFSNPNSTAAVQTATTLAVGEAVLTGKDAAAQKQIATDIVTITKGVQGVLNGDATTVASLVALAAAKVADLHLQPQQQLAANTLLAFVSSELQARVGAGVLKPTDLVIVNQFAGWVITAATPYAG